MLAQNLIRRTLFSDEGRETLAALPAPDVFSGRSALVREVCARFDFRDPRGRLQEAGCLSALRELERAGGIALPPPGPGSGVGRTAQGLAEPVPAAVDVPDRVDRIDGLVALRVDEEADRRRFNEMMRREHPQGAVVHVGRQLRYLIGSEHGWLGGCLFAASALALQPRDRWIGWDAGRREAHLDRVVGLSRFLIRPGTGCRNLASKALSLCLRAMAGDYAARYGVAPLLVETFVGPGQSGASLRAANWTYVGETAGRGRRAAVGARVPTKAIYLYPLARNWRRQLGVAGLGAPPPRPPRWVLGPGDGLDRENWAANEFGAAPVGNAALCKRLVKSAAIQAAAPAKTFFSAACGDAAAVQGYYRMIERPDESALTPEAMLATHRGRTLRRMRGHPTVLCIQDGSDLNFATHHGCSGLGVISKNKGASGTLGLHMHTTFAVNAEGVPLGIPRIEFDAPDGKSDKNKPAAEKKTQRWLRGWRDTNALVADLADTRVISVMDREGDVAELFAAHRDEGGAALLVRAKHDRVLGDGGKLFATMRAAPVRAALEVKVDRASARKAARGQKAFAGREARLARVALRWERIEMPMPAKQKARLGAAPAPLSVVHVHEAEPPKGAEGIEWLLITTVPVTTNQQAREVVDLYGLRWRIEDYHRILKSGCDVEKIAHTTAERIKRAVTINAIIAYRLAALTLLGRETPELLAETMFSKVEIAVLCDFAIERGIALPSTAAQPGDRAPTAVAKGREVPPLSLGCAILLIARLGGYLNRKHDAPPGHQVIWEGYTRLAVATQAMERLIKNGEESPLYNWIRPVKN